MKSALRWAAEVGGLNATARAVLTCLAKHYNHKTGRCFPSMQTIAEFVGCSTRHVIRLLKQLRDVGVIQWTARFSKRGSQTSNEYVLLMKCHAGDDTDVTPTSLNNDFEEKALDPERKEKSLKIDWWHRLALYVNGKHRIWPTTKWGPRPGEPNCLVPTRVILAFSRKHARYLARCPIPGLAISS
jgi:AraC-like DNA-binding protein